jgi:EAL domain-containing protein (putative c-di-GMP-specific phosphodiesterase class I)/ActR/RegA family two-component response regulator
LSKQVVLLLDDERPVTEGLALALEQEGRTVITCNDLESAELALRWFEPTHVVTDVRLSGPFAFEGLDFIRYVKRHSAGTKIVVMTANATDGMQLEASERGAVSFLAKPFDASELATIIELTSPIGPADTPAEVIRIPLLHEVLGGGDLYPVFQPIVALPGREVFAYEALTRCRTDSPLANPARLFEYAARKQRVADLELACLARSVAAFRPAEASALLFANVHPLVFAEGKRLLEVLSAEPAVAMAGRLVLEITEQAALPNQPAVLESIEGLRALGVRFAFDDFGVAYSHLPMIDRVRPAFLKISQDFGTRFETNPTRIKIITNFRSMAGDFGCDLILEGIEDASTAEAAAELGIRYAQGYLFGRPAEAQ